MRFRGIADAQAPRGGVFQYLKGAIQRGDARIRHRAHSDFQYLKGAIQSTRVVHLHHAARIFQYLKGAIQSGPPAPCGPGAAPPFNTSKVRFRGDGREAFARGAAAFNTSKVRFRAEPPHLHIDVPRFFQYLKGAIQRVARRKDLGGGSRFQYLKGAIQSHKPLSHAGPLEGLSIPQRCDSELSMPIGRPDKSSFNTSKVRFRGSPSPFPRPPGTLSIPQRCDSETIFPTTFTFFWGLSIPQRCDSEPASSSRKTALSGADACFRVRFVPFNIVTHRFCVNPGEGDEIIYLHGTVEITTERFSGILYSGGLFRLFCAGPTRSPEAENT